MSYELRSGDKVVNTKTMGPILSRADGSLHRILSDGSLEEVKPKVVERKHHDVGGSDSHVESNPITRAQAELYLGIESVRPVVSPLGNRAARRARQFSKKNR